MMGAPHLSFSPSTSQRGVRRREDFVVADSYGSDHWRSLVSLRENPVGPGGCRPGRAAQLEEALNIASSSRIIGDASRGRSLAAITHPLHGSVVARARC